MRRKTTCRTIRFREFEPGWDDSTGNWPFSISLTRREAWKPELAAAARNSRILLQAQLNPVLIRRGFFLLSFSHMTLVVYIYAKKAILVSNTKETVPGISPTILV